MSQGIKDIKNLWVCSFQEKFCVTLENRWWEPGYCAKAIVAVGEMRYHSAL